MDQMKWFGHSFIQPNKKRLYEKNYYSKGRINTHHGLYEYDRITLDNCIAMQHIKELLEANKLAEVMEHPEMMDGDLILIKARYNQGFKQYNLGLIEFSEWDRIQKQLTYALKELMK